MLTVSLFWPMINRPGGRYKFYSELLRSLSKPVDLVDLSEKSLFNQIIEEKEVRIYG